MMLIEQVLEQVRDATIRLHPQIIVSALDVLESQWRDDAICSYGANLSGYTASKILLHHLTKHYHDKDPDVPWERVRDLERNTRHRRNDLYAKPCKQCAACLSRRKAWPPDRYESLGVTPIRIEFGQITNYTIRRSGCSNHYTNTVKH